MAVLRGLAASFSNSRNGMVQKDMYASERVAARLGEVIVFRSTGPWAKRWIEKGHPTKNFHVKGKSSDWGPQAGLIPFDAMYSKRPEKGSIEDRTKACTKSVHEGWARGVPLILTRSEIDMQLTRKEGVEVAVRRAMPTPDGDMLLWAGPQGSADEYVFRGKKITGRGDALAINVYVDQDAARRTNAFRLADPGSTLATTAMTVMASNEVGADDRGITGDYDLFVVIPTWAAYGGRVGRDIEVQGVKLIGVDAKNQPKGQTFVHGQGMDNVLDPTLHTFGRPAHFGPRTQQATQRFDAAVKETPRSEHKDMGNITPRVLICINALNQEMGAIGAAGVGRRVHHNAENYRNAMFGAMTKSDMLDTSKGGGGHGDGFPLTAFLPPNPSLSGKYGTCCTLENYFDLQGFGVDLHRAGYFVPKNSAWGLAKAFEISG